MLLKDALTKVTEEYINESQKSTRDNALHKYIRKDIPKIIEDVIGKERLKDFHIKASGGEGNWRKVPWITILHRDVSLSRDTNNPEANPPSAKWGYYPVYLFKGDMSRILLQLGQAETNVRKQYPKDVDTILKSRAAILRDKVPEYKDYFDDKISIDLHDESFNSNQVREAKRWVTSTSFGKTYKSRNLPSEEELREDLKNMFELFCKSIDRGGVLERSSIVTIANAQRSSELVDLKGDGVDSTKGIRTTSEYEIEHKEKKLVNRYKKYLEKHNLGTLKKSKIFIPAANVNLETDGWIVESRTLLEAKAHSDREYIRMAIGQLLDYKRHHDPIPSKLAILLPELPNDDLVDLLFTQSIDIVYEKDDKFHVKKSKEK